MNKPPPYEKAPPLLIQNLKQGGGFFIIVTFDRKILEKSARNPSGNSVFSNISEYKSLQNHCFLLYFEVKSRKIFLACGGLFITISTTGT